MPSKFEQLRNGQAVEVEPGVSGRLNLKNKTLELSTGEVMNVANDRDFFPQNDKELAVSRQRESIEKGIKGTGGEFLHQYANQGLVGGILDWPAYLSQSGQEYATRKQAQQDVSSRISQESPWTSAAATGASIATDLAATRGMSGLKAAPILTAGSAGSRLATEPGEVLGETAGAAALGFGLDKTVNYFNRVAQRRGQIRALPGQQEAVREANRVGAENVRNSNILQQNQHNVLKQNVKNSNEARLQQYQQDLTARQNQIIKNENDFAQRKATREAEIVRLKNQAELDKIQRNTNIQQSDAKYKAELDSWKQEEKRLTEQFNLEKKQYEEALKKLPELQKQAQAEFSQNVIKNAERIEKSFPPSSRISTDQLALDTFIDENIAKSGLAGTPQGSQARRILQSIFPEGEIMGGREISRRYKALEESIQKASPEVQNVLNNFKEHLGRTLPSVLEDSIAYNKIVPILKRTIENDVKSILNEIKFAGKGANVAKDQVSRFANTAARHYVRNNITPRNFVRKLQSGDMAREIANGLMDAEAFLIDLSPEEIKRLSKDGTFKFIFEDAKQKHAYFVSELTKKLESRLAKYELKAMDTAKNQSRKFSKEVKNTYGVAEPVPPPPQPVPHTPNPQPIAPTEPPPISPVQLPPPINPTPTPPMPPKPNLLNEPIAPPPNTFTAQPEPTLAPPQGISDRMGDILENDFLTSGKGLINNPFTKLAGLKYVLGKAALPAEAAYLAGKTLTSPTQLGEVARMTFKQGGIRAIETWMQKYPSYRDGILDNPQDRRSLTKEIEDDPEIPLEQKAIIQSKINRGKNLQERL